jgi:hypothetical protein
MTPFFWNVLVFYAWLPVWGTSLSLQPLTPAAVSLRDQNAVSSALGYLPPNLASVAARSSRGEPVVIRVHPLGGGATRRRAKAEQNLTPFPTVLWLVCPKLKKAIGGLERQGLVGKFESRLAEDPSSLEAMVCAHEEYARLRWESLGEDERALAEQRSPRIVSSLRDTGVAGIDWRRTGGSDIKCLHTHYAHFRGGGTKNVVGKWVHELIVDEQPEIL